MQAGCDSCCRAGSVYSLTLCCGGLQITVSHYLREKLFLHAATVTISNTGYKGSSKIICQDVFGSRQITFYLSGNILYRQTKSNSLKGVNVLSLASVKIEEFRAERLNYRELMLTIKIQDTKSGRRITSSKVLLLGNGVIEG